jgi:hypothetical protein
MNEKIKRHTAIYITCIWLGAWAGVGLAQIKSNYDANKVSNANNISEMTMKVER